MIRNIMIILLLANAYEYASGNIGKIPILINAIAVIYLLLEIDQRNEVINKK